MSQTRFRTRLVTWQDSEPLLRAVRSEVFIREQQIPETLEWDADDPRVMHALAVAPDGQPIGTGRLLLHGETAQIGRMAVVVPWRGRGVGAEILSCLLDAARRGGARRAFLHAQTVAVPFYMRAGFVCEGEEFLEVGIPHYKMILDPL